jgi:hypothetical protein
MTALSISPTETLQRDSSVNSLCYQFWELLIYCRTVHKKTATVENCSLADRMDRVYEKD